MDSSQILDMIATNREYIRLKSNIALQNLAMLHKSFDGVEDEACVISLALNDSTAAVAFAADYRRAIDISQQVIDRYPGSQHALLMAAHESVIGRCYTYLIQYDRAHQHLDQALSMVQASEQSDESKGLQADILHNMAMNNYYDGGDSEKTIGYLRRAIDILEPTKYSNRKGVNLMGIGNVRSSAKKYEEALQYHQQAATLFEEVDNYTNLATAIGNMGVCYTNLHQFDEAESCLLRALDMRTRGGNYGDISATYYCLGMLYLEKGDMDKAYSTMLTARDYALVSQAKGRQTLILDQLASMATAAGDEASAAAFLAQSREIKDTLHQD